MKKRLSGIFYLQFALSLLVPVNANANTGTAILAGGCFWCMEADFDQAPGVLNVESGYTGGSYKNPTYDNYRSQGHIEAVRITYDPSVINYTQLLEYFWIHIDPTDGQGQFCDRGHEYSSAIFYLDDDQKNRAESSRLQLEKSGVLKQPVVTAIIAASQFYPAEAYHQDYYLKNPYSYKFYRFTCRRDHRLDELWGDVTFPVSIPADEQVYSRPSDEQIRETLSDLQYKVTQQDATETPFHNEYWDNKREGIYVDIVSGEPLFSSLDKYRSGTGWPSFSKALEPGNIVTREDDGWIGNRIEVRSKYANSHLGHVFNDGPEPTGLRYCMNSAALRFISREELAERGYAHYLQLFDK